MARKNRSYAQLHEQYLSDRKVASNLYREYYDTLKENKNNSSHPDVKKALDKYAVSVKAFKDSRIALSTNPEYLKTAKLSADADQLLINVEFATINRPFLSLTIKFGTFKANLNQIVNTAAGYELLTSTNNQGTIFRESIYRDIERFMKTFKSDAEFASLSAKFQGMCSVIEKISQTA